MTFYISAVKFSKEGSELWSKRWGKEDGVEEGKDRRLLAAAIDSKDNLYMTGYTEDNWNDSNSGGKDSFLVKLLPDGTTQWQKLWWMKEREQLLLDPM